MMTGEGNTILHLSINQAPLLAENNVFRVCLLLPKQFGRMLPPCFLYMPAHRKWLGRLNLLFKTTVQRGGLVFLLRWSGHHSVCTLLHGWVTARKIKL